MQYVKSKMIVDSDPGRFEIRLNQFLDSLDAERKQYSVQYGTCPWSADGQGGTEFSALVLFSEKGR